MSCPRVLRHLHLPSITPFSHTSTLQTTLVSQFLTHKALTSSKPPPSSPIPPAPTPTLLTFVPTPVYTTGRRELGTLTTDQINLLKRPLPSAKDKDQGEDEDAALHANTSQHAEVQETLRGGQITFHGPGQLVIYPILDLKGINSPGSTSPQPQSQPQGAAPSPAPKWPKGISARCYVHLLEETTIRTLSRFGIAGRRTENPGVWVDADTKIAALGVHLRRNVTGFGVGLNVSTDLRWFERIVACGLEGKRTTSMTAEMLKARGGGGEGGKAGSFGGPTTEEVADVWAAEFAAGLWGEGGVVRRITEREVLGDLDLLEDVGRRDA